MSDNIEQKVMDIVASTLKVDKKSISRESKFVDDLGADSLDLVELIMAIDAEFDCDTSDEEAAKITTIDQVIKYVEEKKSN